MANRLYIIMRTDMASMGRGRAIAEGSHIANQMVWEHVVCPMMEGGIPNQAIIDWHKEANGFGTAIVLRCKNEVEMNNVHTLAIANGFLSKIVYDPEYYVMDGDYAIRLTDVPVGVYVFGDHLELKPYLGDFEAMPNDPVGRE